MPTVGWLAGSILFDCSADSANCDGRMPPSVPYGPAKRGVGHQRRQKGARPFAATTVSFQVRKASKYSAVGCAGATALTAAILFFIGRWSNENLSSVAGDIAWELIPVLLGVLSSVVTRK